MKRIATIILALGMPSAATSALAQQGFEPKVPGSIPNQTTVQPQSQPSSPTLEVPQVPQAMHGCWVGTPTTTHIIVGYFTPETQRLCFNPQPEWRTWESYDTSNAWLRTTVAATGPDWVQFTQESGNGGNLKHDVFHCRLLSQSQITCQGSSVMTCNGQLCLSGDWVSTLDRE
jgi:hypothetical protein